MIAVFENEHVRVAALHGWLTGELDVSCEGLAADDVLHPQPGRLPPPLAEAALLNPLYGPAQQLGALILGRLRNAVGFSPEDVDQLLYPSDRLSDIVWSAHRKAECAAQVTQGVDLAPSRNISHPAQVSVAAVDNALRHMSSYGYLGQHPLPLAGGAGAAGCRCGHAHRPGQSSLWHVGRRHREAPPGDLTGHNSPLPGVAPIPDPARRLRGRHVQPRHHVTAVHLPLHLSPHAPGSAASPGPDPGRDERSRGPRWPC